MPAKSAALLLAISKLTVRAHARWEPDWRIPGPPLWLAIAIAVSALHAYAAWLEEGIPRMAAFVPMGRANYDLYLRRVHLLPFNAEQVEMLGQAELNRYRGLESLLADPSLASPDPARAKNVPADQQAFLAAYQGREKEMIEFLQKNRLITLPAYLGPFSIRQLPDAFKPTSPGGFMNPPGLYDKDPEGFYFIPTYNPKSENFYIRAAIEDPRPILGHEGIPGHFLQISIANHLPDEIRRQHGDNVFVEGWALYGEEMLSRQGLYRRIRRRRARCCGCRATARRASAWT